MCGCGSSSQSYNTNFSTHDELTDETTADSDISRAQSSQTNNNGEPLSSSSTPKRHFSTNTANSSLGQFLHLKHNFYKNGKNYYHTSSTNYALTSEQLLKLAKLKKMRKSQEKASNNMQTLNPESKEKKVPSSRIGRLSSFGGEFCCGLILFGLQVTLANIIFV